MHILYKSLDIALISLLLFCSKQDKIPSPEVNELAFEVDSSKLELRSLDQNLGIQFNSPKGWALILPLLSEEFRKQGAATFLEKTDFDITPISIFLNKENKSLLHISQIQKLDDSIRVEKYKDLIQKKLHQPKWEIS